MSKIVLYIDWLSQPSRFCATVLKMLKVEHEIQEIRIGENKQRTPEYAKINPFRKVPAIKDGEFNLAESHTIAKYVIRSRNIQTQLQILQYARYPIQDVKQCALIDQQLDWHHTNTRKCSQLFFNIVIAPRLGIETTINIEQAQKEVESVLKFIDQHILQKQQYMVGDTLTLADISTFCELYQLLIIKYDFSKFTNIVAWQKRVWQIPEIVETHQAVAKVVKKQNPQAKL